MQKSECSAQGTEPPLSRASDKGVTGEDFSNIQKGSSSETVDLTVDTDAPSTLTTSDGRNTCNGIYGVVEDMQNVKSNLDHQLFSRSPPSTKQNSSNSGNITSVQKKKKKKKKNAESKPEIRSPILRKHTYSNILKISPPKTESVQIKI